MNDLIIEFEPLVRGVLIKRYKRFLADIQIDNGEIVTAHCANTGPMKGCLLYTSPSPRDGLLSRMPSSA